MDRTIVTANAVSAIPKNGRRSIAYPFSIIESGFFKFLNNR